MDRIAPVPQHAASPLSVSPAPGRPSIVIPGPAPAPVVPKGIGDYFRALRQRAWLALAVAVAIGAGGSTWILRLPAVYRVIAQVQIEPPQYDDYLGTLVGDGRVGQLPPQVVEKYVPNRLAYLRSKGLAEQAVADPAIRALPGAVGDPATELMTELQTRRLPDSNIFDVTLEGRNPERTAKLLNTLLDLFRDETRKDQLTKVEESKRLAGASLEHLTGELKNLNETIMRTLADSSIFTPDGDTLPARNYEAAHSDLIRYRQILDQLQQESRIAQLVPPHHEPTSEDVAYQTRVHELTKEQRYWAQQQTMAQRRIRNYGSDPSGAHISRMLRQANADLTDALHHHPAEHAEVDTSALKAAGARRRVEQLEREVKDLMVQMKGSMPAVQRYLTLLKERDQKYSAVAAMQAKLGEFEMLAKTQTPPVQVLFRASEPSAPVKPNRPICIALISVLGIALGIGLVCGLEYIDHSVKVPEHLTSGLGLPLFGVVPRMRRLARISRGGHLWTPGAPASAEADAYRNLRASLLGATGAGGPIVSLLVTSAKAGEGKSTTALNLAATCARAGERTLLLDADLRRPSLADVFGEGKRGPGLVEILRGDLPWQRAVVRADLPNLDFLPTGETADVPIEVLGTLELRQLLTALTGHYDRVIVDGPAVLGMADCRMLGRMVDAALMVVRSGMHELRPLLRAKAMMEQSRVPIAGIVFNGLADDFQNWSSFTTYLPVDSVSSSSGGGPTRSQGLEAPPTDPAAAVMAMAGSLGA